MVDEPRPRFLIQHERVVAPKPAQAPVNGRGPGQAASEKQVQALYAIGKRKGLDLTAVQAWIQAQMGKTLQELSGREASGLIRQLLDT
jgi:hypothetical protein